MTSKELKKLIIDYPMEWVKVDEKSFKKILEDFDKLAGEQIKSYVSTILMEAKYYCKSMDENYFCAKKVDCYEDGYEYYINTNFEKVLRGWKMTTFGIVNRLTDAIRNSEYNYKKVWFEMYCCVEDKADCKRTIKFTSIYRKKNSIVLCYKRKEAIELTKDNCIWISAVYICDKNMKVKVVDYDYARIDEVID